MTQSMGAIKRAPKGGLTLASRVNLAVHPAPTTIKLGNVALSPRLPVS
jgi:hypothetical protein